MSVETVSYVAEPGENIIDTIKRAIARASDLNVPVEVNHNDRKFTVSYDTDPDMAYRWWDDLGTYSQNKHAIGGVWVSVGDGNEGVVIFAGEIDALRHGVKNMTEVCWWAFGTTLQQALNGGEEKSDG